MVQQVKDIDGDMLNVGDIIIMSSYSSLLKCLILGFTDRSIVISRSSRSFPNWAGESKRYLSSDNDINNHDSKQYISSRYIRVYKIGEIDEFPEKLLKFVKHNQIKFK